MDSKIRLQIQVLLFLFIHTTSAAQCWESVAKGYFHYVAVKEDGTLWAWGANYSGQLGDGTNTHRLVPTQIGTDTDWAKVEAGSSHSLGIKQDGTLWAWGDNEYYQLGIGNTADRNEPTQIGTDNDWQLMDGGNYHTIAIKSNGTMWSWGENIESVLGFGVGVQYAAVPTQLGTDTDWKTVSTSTWHVQAIKTNGTLWAWGRGDGHLLGNGSNTDVHVPTQVGTASDWSKISIGNESNSAIKTDGTLWTWGLNDYGQLGHGQFPPPSYVPRKVGVANDWDIVANLGISMLALKTDGTLWSWGNDGWGHLGFGFLTGGFSTPTQVGTANDWEAVYKSANACNFSGLKTDGTLWVNGRNAYGEIGNGTTQVEIPLFAHTCTQLNTQETFAAVHKLRVYPNPATTFFAVDYEGSQQKFEYFIYDMTGRIAQSGYSFPGDKIEIQQMLPGIYLLRTTMDTKSYTHKLVKN